MAIASLSSVRTALCGRSTLTRATTGLTVWVRSELRCRSVLRSSSSGSTQTPPRRVFCKQKRTCGCRSMSSSHCRRSRAATPTSGTTSCPSSLSEHLTARSRPRVRACCSRTAWHSNRPLTVSAAACWRRSVCPPRRNLKWRTASRPKCWASPHLTSGCISWICAARSTRRTPTHSHQHDARRPLTSRSWSSHPNSAPSCSGGWTICTAR
mmetsp:Transcript_17189/g.41300  ORF Transcript_17189/g.41300 Transcript_17189/m.41300 type:complete len:210 (+) Transcript_17189:294-923(+)